VGPPFNNELLYGAANIVPHCPVTYDVFFDTNNPPTTLLCNDVSVTTCNPGSLVVGTYYWKVVSTNCCGTTPGPVWSFSVCAAPSTPSNIQATPSTICSGQCSTLSATVSAGETVDWFTGSCGGTAVAGGASPSVCPTSTATYYARARNTSTGCVSTACASIMVNVHFGHPRQRR
jgi:hypothetical protein